MIRKIWAGYEYFFYKLFTWGLYTSKGNEGHSERVSCITLAGINWLYVYIFSAILQYVTGYGYKQLSGLTKFQTIFLFSIIVFLNYFIFIRNNKLKELIKKYGNESRKERIYGNIYTCFVIVFSLILFFLSASLFLKPSDFVTRP